MRAFEVFYQTGGKSTKTIVLAEDETGVEKSLSNKDVEYEIGGRWSKINRQKEIQLSNVLISDLSVSEFLKILK